MAETDGNYKLQQLKKLFPDAVRDGTVDYAQIQRELGAQDSARRPNPIVASLEEAAPNAAHSGTVSNSEARAIMTVLRQHYPGVFMAEMTDAAQAGQLWQMLQRTQPGLFPEGNVDWEALIGYVEDAEKLADRTLRGHVADCLGRIKRNFPDVVDTEGMPDGARIIEALASEFPDIFPQQNPSNQQRREQFQMLQRNLPDAFRDNTLDWDKLVRAHFLFRIGRNSPEGEDLIFELVPEAVASSEQEIQEWGDRFAHVWEKFQRNAA